MGDSNKDKTSFIQNIGIFFIFVGAILFGLTLTAYRINENMDTETGIYGLGLGTVSMIIGALIYYFL